MLKVNFKILYFIQMVLFYPNPLNFLIRTHSNSTTIPVILPEVPITPKSNNTGTQIVQQGITKNCCPLCNKTFVHDHALRKHLINHNSKVFACNQCNKTFKNQSTLTSHKISHTMVLPFTCEVCHKSFNRISTLKSHRKIHSGAKPFACHVCKKAFYQKGNLKNHLYIHTNERPYRCEICSRGFNQMSNLVCHKRNAHRVTTVPAYPRYCPYCAMQFETPEQLASHELEMHYRPAVNNLSVLETETQLVRVNTFIDDVDPMKDIEVLVDDNDNDVKPHLMFGQSIPLDLSSGTLALNRNALDNDPMICPELAKNMQKNCQMVFERTENHIFFSKFSVIELPQKIDTLEMKYAETTNKTPFAMLHFGDDVPCLVEIIQQRGMSILKPIKKHELGNLTFHEPDPNDHAASSKIVITIVATILQSFTKGEYSLFTVKSPEIVRCVKLLVDSEVAKPENSGNNFMNCVKAEELMELKNKVTIAMSDYHGIGNGSHRSEVKDRGDSRRMNLQLKEEPIEY